MKSLLSGLATLALGIGMLASFTSPQAAAQTKQQPAEPEKLTTVNEPGDTLKGEDRRIVSFNKDKRKVSVWIKYLDARTRTEAYDPASGKMTTATETTPAGITSVSEFDEDGTLVRATLNQRKRPTVIFLNHQKLPEIVNVKVGTQVRIMLGQGSNDGRGFAHINATPLEPGGRGPVVQQVQAPKGFSPPAGFNDASGVVILAPGSVRCYIYTGGQPLTFILTASK